MYEPDEPTQDGAIFLRGLRMALARVPLWLLAWAVPFLLSLALATSFGATFARAIAHRYALGSLVGTLDENFRFDQRRLLESESTAAAAAALGMVALFAGIFAAGGWLQVFLERTRGHSVRRFLWGGARYFWRFLRVAVLTVLLLALLSWLFYGGAWNWMLGLLIGAKEGNLEVLRSEWSALWIRWIQAGLYAAGFALALVWGDYTRTRLALHDRRSAFVAGVQSGYLLLRHPWRTLRPFGLVFLLEAAGVALLGNLAWSLGADLGPDSGWLVLALLFVLGQGALLWQAICRGARYAAAVQVSRALVAPLAAPDPWASRVGGPGGPQYPIDDTDDYGVSI